MSVTISDWYPPNHLHWPRKHHCIGRPGRVQIIMLWRREGVEIKALLCGFGFFPCKNVKAGKKSTKAAGNFQVSCICLFLLFLKFFFLKIWESFLVGWFVFPASYWLISGSESLEICMAISLCLADLIALTGQLPVPDRNKCKKVRQYEQTDWNEGI